MVTAFRTNLLCATALSIACALAVPAHAQDAASQGEKPEAQEGGLETIVVTAQKREQNLQDVPAAVSAIGGETLRTRGITETSDLMGAIPACKSPLPMVAPNRISRCAGFQWRTNFPPPLRRRLRLCR